jgi:hypothetical protein
MPCYWPRAPFRADALCLPGRKLGSPTGAPIAHCMGVFLILLTLLTATASAQFISLGIKGGVPLGQTLSGKTIDPIGILGRCGECASGRTLPYLIGPSIEVHLPRSFSVSVDALYNRTDYSHTSTTPINAAFVVFNTEKHAIDRLVFGDN